MLLSTYSKYWLYNDSRLYFKSSFISKLSDFIKSLYLDEASLIVIEQKKKKISVMQFLVSEFNIYLIS